MSFSATPNYTGVPSFGIIHVDATETAKAFQVYLDTGSKLTGVSLNDIKTGVSAMPADHLTVNLVELLNLGMKLFDAVIWLHAGRPSTHPLTVDVNMTSENIPSQHSIAKAVFYCYFMLLTQARYPVPASEPEKPRVPNFLKTIMGLDADQSYYVEMLCSFPPQQFDPAWVRYVHFTNFGQEVLSRFGLGVAGYRMFGPFALYDARPNMDKTLNGAFTFARNVARAPASWNVHPLTRAPGVLKSRGNLNKNLGNLMLDAFTDEQLSEMASAKVIFKKPIREPTHRNYKTWAPEDDISGTARIFPLDS